MKAEYYRSGAVVFTEHVRLIPEISKTASRLELMLNMRRLLPRLSSDNAEFRSSALAEWPLFVSR